MCRIVSSCWILKCEYKILHSFFYWLDPECNLMNKLFCPLKDFLLKLRLHIQKNIGFTFLVSPSHTWHIIIYITYFTSPTQLFVKNLYPLLFKAVHSTERTEKSQFVWSSELRYTNPAAYRSAEFRHYV